MKKFFTLFCAALLSLSAANAEVLFNEKFDSRSKGDLKSGEWSTSLSADGKWYNSLGSTYIQVVEKQLSKSGYCASTSGKAAQFTANHGKDFTVFKKSSASGKAYLAFLLKVNTLKTSSGAKGASNLIAALWSDISSNAAGYMYGQVKIKTIDEDTYNLGIAKRTETAVFADSVLEIGKTYLVVSEYIFLDGVDSVNLYINPTMTSQVISKSANLTPTGAQTDAAGIIGAVLASNGNTPSDMLIDEIKVATSWADLWESAPEPELDPMIVADEEIVLGDPLAGTFSFETYEGEIEVLAEDLSNAITITHTNNAIQLSTTSLPKEGGKLTITLENPQNDGYGYDTIAFVSGETSDTTIVWWYNNIVSSYSTISSLKAAYADDTEYGFYYYSGEAIVTRKYLNPSTYVYYLQDETGALFLSDEWTQLSEDLNVGDKVSKMLGMAGEYGYTGRALIAYADPTIISTGNSVTPKTITLAALQAAPMDHLLEVIKLENVTLDQKGDVFKAGSNVGITQGEQNANIQPISSDADYIGMTIPSKADIVGYSTNIAGTIIVPRDMNDIITGATTLIEPETQGTKAVKMIQNGQLIILRDGKVYNVLGTRVQ